MDRSKTIVAVLAVAIVSTAFYYLYIYNPIVDQRELGESYDRLEDVRCVAQVSCYPMLVGKMVQTHCDTIYGYRLEHQLVQRYMTWRRHGERQVGEQIITRQILTECK